MQRSILLLAFLSLASCAGGLGPNTVYPTGIVGGSEYSGEDLPANLPVSDREPVPTVRVEPRLPPEAAAYCINDGHVVFEFIVTREGEPANIRILESEPSGIFSRTTYNAFRRWRFEPPMENGEWRPVLETMTFNLAAPGGTCE